MPRPAPHTTHVTRQSIRDNLEALCFPRHRLLLCAIVVLVLNGMLSVPMLILIPLNATPQVFKSSPLLFTAISTTFLLVGSVCFTIAKLREYKLAAAGIFRRFRYCWKCAYPLPLEVRQGICPECGRPWTAQELRARWANVICQMRQRCNV